MGTRYLYLTLAVLGLAFAPPVYAQAPASAATGVYEMVQFYDEPLPVSIYLFQAPANACLEGRFESGKITGGRITLNADGSATVEETARVDCGPGGIRDAVDRRTDPYEVKGSRIQVQRKRRSDLTLEYDPAEQTLIRKTRQGVTVWRKMAPPLAETAAADRDEAADRDASSAIVTGSGEYGLVRAGGDPVPVELPPSGNCTQKLAGGKLSLRDDGTFQLNTTIFESCLGSSGSLGLSYEGTFRATSNEIHFTEHGELGAFRGTREEDSVTLPLGDLQLTFAAGASGEVDVHAMMMQEIEEGIAASRIARSYDCESDPILAAAPAIAVADTAGLGARIRSAFPGYHLSTEREIACRFPLLDGSPDVHIASFGTGRAWWVERVDLDDDGREDVLAVLTSDEDPQEDLLVALFANGRAVPVTSLGGWDFSSVKDDRGTLVYIVYWEKGADPYRWTGEAFEPWDDPDACCE